MTEEVIYHLVEFQGAMAHTMDATIEVAAHTFEAEEPLKADKVQKWKVADLKLELQRRALYKMVIRMCFTINF